MRSSVMRNAASEYLTANPGAFLPIGIFFGIGCLVCLCVGVRAVITRRERKSAREIRQGMRRGDQFRKTAPRRSVPGLLP